MIRQATVEDLPPIMDLAERFASTVPAMNRFNRERAMESWRALLESGAGTILISDDYTGMLAAAVHADPYSGDLVASEMAWFVDEKSRGNGIRLLIAFEKWAKSIGCKRLAMTHLATPHSSRAGSVYERRGYVPAETIFIKDI